MATPSYHTPAHYPAIANRWMKLGIDPRRFFRQDGTMDEAFFAVPGILTAPAVVPAPAPTPNSGVGSVLINITINQA